MIFTILGAVQIEQKLQHSNLLKNIIWAIRYSGTSIKQNMTHMPTLFMRN